MRARTFLLLMTSSLPGPSKAENGGWSPLWTLLGFGVAMTFLWVVTEPLRALAARFPVPERNSPGQRFRRVSASLAGFSFRRSLVVTLTPEGVRFGTFMTEVLRRLPAPNVLRGVFVPWEAVKEVRTTDTQSLRGASDGERPTEVVLLLATASTDDDRIPLRGPVAMAVKEAHVAYTERIHAMPAPTAYR